VRFALARYLATYGAPVDLEQLIARASPDIQAVFHSDVLPGGKNFVTETVYVAARDRYVPELKRASRLFRAPPAGCDGVSRNARAGAAHRR
jgi:hypothetical protein